MGYNQRGVRDGTGPYKGSFQRKSGSSFGKRKSRGQECPNKKGGK